MGDSKLSYATYYILVTEPLPATLPMAFLQYS